MTWYVPYDKLDSKQIEIINGITRSPDRSHWVQGYAGTGKTIILTHAIERVAADEPNASLCYITFTHALKDMVASGLHGPVAKRIEIKTHTRFLYDQRRYDYVFLDEVQDIKPSDLDKIRSLAGSVIVAGDPEQCIYENSGSKPEILSTLTPQEWFLEQIFRLTPLLRKVAQAILPSSKIVEGLMANKNANVTIRLVSFRDQGSEADWVWEEARKRARPSTPSVILFPTHKAIADFSFELARQLCIDGPPSAVVRDRKTHNDDPFNEIEEPPRAVVRDRLSRNYGPFNEYWKENGLALQYLGNDQGSFADGEQRPVVYMMTFHSAKGLDFENVFIPGMSEGAYLVDPSVIERNPDLDRRLLFVAVTRSRKNLFVSYHGKRPHRLVANFPQDAAVPFPQDAAVPKRTTARSAFDDEDLF